MDPLTAAALAGGQMFLGYMGQRETNQMNQRMASNQMDFQERMSRTAHQREVQDLIEAGLNPILSAGGSGASTPPGASAEMVSPLSKAMEGLSTGMETAIQLRGQNATIKNLDADSENKKASNALIINQAASSAKDVEQKAMANEVLNKTLQAQIKKANAEGNYAEINQLMGILNAGASSANSLIDIGKIIKSFPKTNTPNPTLKGKK